jgi:hypothetical protein
MLWNFATSGLAMLAENSDKGHEAGDVLMSILDYAFGISSQAQVLTFN